MIVLEVCIVVLLIGLTGALLAGRVATSVADPVSSHAFRPLPEGRVGGDDVAGLLFDQGLRGYRMDQVDEVLDRLGAELDERDARIAELRRSLMAGRGGPGVDNIGERG